MKRSAVLTLRNKKWVDVPSTDGLSVCVVPSAGTTMVGLAQVISSDEIRSWICRNVFVDFKGYTEDDGKTPVANTIKNRLELLTLTPVFYAIQAAVAESQMEILQGEPAAASD